MSLTFSYCSNKRSGLSTQTKIHTQHVCLVFTIKYSCIDFLFISSLLLFGGVIRCYSLGTNVVFARRLTFFLFVVQLLKEEIDDAETGFEEDEDYFISVSFTLLIKLYSMVVS